MGSPKLRRSILVNDKRLVIRQNLHDLFVYYQTEGNNVSQVHKSALPRPQNQGPREDTLLWIDQISIDQANMAERSSQVQLMSEISSQSSLAIV
jgi:hypothetical protein